MISSGREAFGGFAEQVLDVVDAIPPGQVMSYGDIAEYLGQGGPRQVGRVLAVWGGGVAWWRVIHADGSLLASGKNPDSETYTLDVAAPMGDVTAIRLEALQADDLEAGILRRHRRGQRQGLAVPRGGAAQVPFPHAERLERPLLSPNAR